jgi:SAM-dependent methyltransferase
MSVSYGHLDKEFCELVNGLDVTTALDIGCGQGKRGRQIREAHPKAHITGVDIVAEYGEKFNLGAVYDVVELEGVWNYILPRLDRKFDLIVLGDVIEHLLKSDGVNLLHVLSYMAKNIVVIYPENLAQGASYGQEADRHLSRWRIDDFCQVDINAQYRWTRRECTHMVHMRPQWFVEYQ